MPTDNVAAIWKAPTKLLLKNLRLVRLSKGRARNQLGGSWENPTDRDLRSHWFLDHN